MSQPVIVNKKPPSRLYLTERRKSSLTAYLYIAPFFILFIIFGLYPILFTFFLSLNKWNPLTGDMSFVGLNNFDLILSDPLFFTSFTNTLLIGIMGTIPQLIIALLLAITLNSAVVRMKQMWRVIYFLPNITSIVAVTLIFSAIFGNNGMANWFLDLFGIDPVSWNSGWWGVKIAIAVMIMWRWVGYNAIIYLAGLQSIPSDLYEAARIDGANRRKLLMYITIPLLKPFIIFTILLSTIGSLQVFTEPFVFLGQGGTGSTRAEGVTMVVYLYSEAFRLHYFGTAAAVAVMLFFITIVFSVINSWLGSQFGESKPRKKKGVKA